MKTTVQWMSSLRKSFYRKTTYFDFELFAEIAIKTLQQRRTLSIGISLMTSFGLDSNTPFPHNSFLAASALGIANEANLLPSLLGTVIDWPQLPIVNVSS